ncbi:hypothetical protein [Sphingomonas melonis]|uniref:hypothetical protein n=1 Tax=Sphingomonas melonis TaxID=152682 RepID=UPI0035C84C36
MDNIVIKVWTQHAAEHGMEAYAAEAFTAEISLDGNTDHAQLMAANMVGYLSKAYAGDRISVRVDLPRRSGVEQFVFLGKADGANEYEHFEATLAQIANAVER